MMEKNKWQNAEILELGVESTKEDNEKTIHMCKYCGHVFPNGWLKKEHEMICPKKPASPGFGPEGNVTPSLS